MATGGPSVRRLAVIVVAVLSSGAAAAALPALPVGAQTTTTRAAQVGGRDLTVVNYNLLHGIFCPQETANCRAPDRVALFLRQLQDAKCPEVVGLQEVNDNLATLLAQQLPSVCGGKYRAAMKPTAGNDKEFIFSTIPAKKAKVVRLPGGLRGATRVQLRSDLGPVVLVVTHQDGDKAFPACRSDIERYKCPKPCAEGTTFPECQTVLGERLVLERGPENAIRIYMGDFNLPAGTPRYARLTANGWVDTHLAAGNAECNAATGAQCTAGRNDVTLTALQDPNAKESERIDFIFAKAPSRCTPRFDGAADTDGDGVPTGLFAAAPAVNGPAGLVWPSDHTAVSMDMSCA
jgi:endonuclease/exonuclease/phosphatase family metal-dependent hydrolase